MCYWKCCVPLITQWFCWSDNPYYINGYFIGNINPTFSDKPKWCFNVFFWCHKRGLGTNWVHEMADQENLRFLDLQSLSSFLGEKQWFKNVQTEKTKPTGMKLEVVIWRFVSMSGPYHSSISFDSKVNRSQRLSQSHRRNPWSNRDRTWWTSIVLIFTSFGLSSKMKQNSQPVWLLLVRVKTVKPLHRYVSLTNLLFGL